MTQYLFTGGKLLDPAQSELLDGLEVLIEDDHIKEVSSVPIKSSSATRINLDGRTLMPGLIDAHVHVVASYINAETNALLSNALVALRTARVMRHMLMRGFTTVRDAGGAEHGFVLALQEGLIIGPRLLICGKALSQTGGHADFRGRFDNRPGVLGERLGAIGDLCDGIDGMRRAVREQIKHGANFIKIMANGGVASPIDPIHALGFSVDEIRVAVEEARNAGTYVAAHLYTDQAIRRAVECGVYSLEHCNLIEPDTAELAAQAGAIAVPTLVAYEALALEGEKFGLSTDSATKIETVRRRGMESLDVMRRAGLPMAFGTDLLGPLQKHQCMEFSILERVLSPQEIIVSATTVGAKLCKMEGLIGEISSGAYADILVVDGDPLKDLSVLKNDGARISAIMSNGNFVKNNINM